MKHQFALEQTILECWGITSDLEIVKETIETNSSLTREELNEIINSLIIIYNIKFNKCFKEFENCVKENRTN